MNKIDFSVLLESRTKKPFGLWAMNGKEFDHDYILDLKWFELRDFFFESFEKIDWNKVNIIDFWDYWTSQGGYDYYISGPFSINVEFIASEFVEEYINKLNELMKMIKEGKVINNYENL